MKKISFLTFIVLTLLLIGEINAQNSPVRSASKSVNLNYLPKFSFLSNGTGIDTINNSLIYDNGANIGIGTSTPAFLLSVQTSKIASYLESNYWPTPTVAVENITNDPNTLMQFATLGFVVCSKTSGNNSMGAISLIQPTYLSRASTFTFSLRNSSGITNEVMRLQSDGNMGIGISTPGSKLQVNGNAVVGFSNSTSAPVNGLLVSGNVGIGTQTPGSRLQVNGNAVIGYSSSTSAPANGLLVNGNVGIGVSTPTERLDVMGNIRVSGTLFTNKLYAANGIDSRYFYSDSAFKFRVPSGIAVTITESGNMGIGNQTPRAKLDVTGNGTISENFTVSKKLEVLGSLMIDSLAGEGYRPDSTSNRSYRMLYVDDLGRITADLGDPVYGSCLENNFPWHFGGDSPSLYSLTAIGTCNNMPFRLKTYGQERIRITPEGYVGIGTTTPTQKLEVNGNLLCNGKIGIGSAVPDEFKLAVDGKIICEEVKVQLSEYWVWPDYVFNEDYNVMSLSELEAYVKTYRHLPNVPSESEVKNEGIKVGEMNSVLLQKIEELTLYIIDLEKRIQELEKSDNQ